MACEQASLDATTVGESGLFMREAALGCVSMFGKQTDIAKARIMSGPAVLSKNVFFWAKISVVSGLVEPY